MDRRIEDRGCYARQVDGIWNGRENERLGQDRGKHDLLAEARELLKPIQVGSNIYREQESAPALRILITMMERRK